MKCVKLIVCFLLGLIFPLTAQHVSNNGTFSIPSRYVCAPYNNIVFDTNGLCGNCTVDFNLNDGQPQSIPVTDGQIVNPALFPGYTQPGTYVIQLQAGAQFDQLEVTILPATPPAFETYTCSANQVRVNITETTATQYTVDYNNDNVADITTPPGLVLPHTYGTAVQQTINVRAAFPNCPSSSATITPVPGAFNPASLRIDRLEVLQNNNIQLDLATTDNYYYELYMRTNAGTQVLNQQLSNQNNVTITGLFPEQNYYCFQVRAVDICQTTTATFSGNEICSADLDLSLLQNMNRLTWATRATGITGFSLLKNSAVTPFAASATGFDDTDITCGTEYCYQLVSDHGNGITSLSKTVCGTGSTNIAPAPIEDVTAIITDGGVQLTWLEQPGFTVDEYTVRRRTRQGSKLFQTADPQFSDETYKPFENVCYIIDYADVCGLRSSPGAEVCPINLTASITPTNTVALEWTAYGGWKDGVDRYVIEKYSRDGTLIASIPAGNALSYTDTGSPSEADQVYSYRVLAVAVNGTLLSQSSVSNTRQAIKNPNLVHPTAFIPNSSIAENKSFRILGSFIDTYEMRVFNRWGELMFESRDKNVGWDGTYRGIAMPEGKYIFKARITDEAGRTFDYAGSVILLTRQ